MTIAVIITPAIKIYVFDIISIFSKMLQVKEWKEPKGLQINFEGLQPFREKGCCQRNLWLEPALGQPRPAWRPCFSSPFRASRGRISGQNARKSNFGGPCGIELELLSQAKTHSV